MINIRQLQKDIHQNAIDHGWYQEKRTVKEFRLLICSKVFKAFECWEKGEIETKFICKGFYKIKFKEGPDEHHDALFDIPVVNKGTGDVYGEPVGLGSELADIVIRCLDMCEYFKRYDHGIIIDNYEYINTIKFLPDFFDEMVQEFYKDNLGLIGIPDCCYEEELDFFFDYTVRYLIDKVRMLAAHFNIDLEKEILQKHEYNKHGNKEC